MGAKRIKRAKRDTGDKKPTGIWGADRAKQSQRDCKEQIESLNWRNIKEPRNQWSKLDSASQASEWWNTNESLDLEHSKNSM